MIWNQCQVDSSTFWPVGFPQGRMGPSSNTSLYGEFVCLPDHLAFPVETTSLQQYSLSNLEIASDEGAGTSSVPSAIAQWYLTSRPGLLRHFGAWQGDDFEECLATVKAARGGMELT